MNICYRIELSEAERAKLQAMLSGGRHAARTLKRAQILGAADAGVPDEDIARSVALGGSTVYRTKRRFVEGNLERALSEEPRPSAARNLSGPEEEALLVATACARPPAGRARWTLELLAGKIVRLTNHESLSRATVRRHLAKTHSSPGRRRWGVSPRSTASMWRVWRTCSTSMPKPSIRCGQWCVLIKAQPSSSARRVSRSRSRPGQIERFDDEDRRNGTVNLFVFLDTHRPWRKVNVTDRRTKNFAVCLRELVDLRDSQAERIRVAMDNLSTPTPGSLDEAFSALEAHRILGRLEFHFTPKQPVIARSCLTACELA